MQEVIGSIPIFSTKKRLPNKAVFSFSIYTLHHIPPATLYPLENLPLLLFFHLPHIRQLNGAYTHLVFPVDILTATIRNLTILATKEKAPRC